jgi:hypothetical protein
MGWFSHKRAPTRRASSADHVAGANGFGVPFHLVFTWHPLPEAGAMQYSYDTLCLPRYSPIGNGPGNAREFETCNPVVQPLHGVHLSAIGSPGVLTGQLVAQPLMDITSTASQPVNNAFAGISLSPGQYQLPV